MSEQEHQPPAPPKRRRPPRAKAEGRIHPARQPQIVVTGIEAIFGLVIEGVFIAMLTQRFFNR